MDSVFTEVSQTLDWSVEMKRTLRTRVRNKNALAMLGKREFSAFLDTLGRSEYRVLATLFYGG